MWYCDDAERDEPLMIPEIHNHHIRKRYSSSNERYRNPQSLAISWEQGGRLTAAFSARHILCRVTKDVALLAVYII